MNLARNYGDIYKDLYAINKVLLLLNEHGDPSFLFQNLRWLKTVSSTKILMGFYSHSLSLAATIMVSKNCPTIGEHVVVLFIT